MIKPQLTKEQLNTILSMAKYWDEVSKRENLEQVKNIAFDELHFQLQSVITPMQIILIVGEWAKQQES